MNSLLVEYFRFSFKEKKDWVLDTGSEQEIYSYQSIKDASLRMKKTDPQLYLYLEYLWLCPTVSRNNIAKNRNMDASTLNRTWSKAIDIIKNYITHPDLTPELEEVNFITYD